MDRLLQRQLLEELAGRRLPLWPDAPAQFVMPDYALRSLANVPATLAHLLGGSLEGCAPALAESYWSDFGDVRRVVCVLLDALGWHQLLQMMAAPDGGGAWGNLAQRGRLLPMTSIYPSTTATALTTLMTGRTPIEHGMLGYELWLREFGVHAQMLATQPSRGLGRETLLDWGFEPSSFVPVPGLGKLLAENNIETTCHTPVQFTRSAFSRMLYRGFTRVVGYNGVEQMWDHARRFVHRTKAKRSLHWVYWGGIDHAAHVHGSADVPEGWMAEYRNAARAFEERFLNRLSDRDRRGTLIVMLADHGFVDSPADLAHRVDTDGVFDHELLVPPSGEARAAYLHTVSGGYPGVQQRFEHALGPEFVVKQSSDVVKAGLFGDAKPYVESVRRLGHLHVMPKGLEYLDRGQGHKLLKGRHGGLLDHEMLVPWLACRLDG